MATTVEGCRGIIDACAAAGTMLMVAFTQRYRGSNRRGYELLRSGRLGRLLSIQDYARVPEGLKAYPESQKRPESIGILLGYGVHNIDRLRWFLDDEPACVEARVLRSPTGIETTTMALLQWKKGALASFWSSVDLPLPGFRSTAFRCLVVAEKGLLDVDGYGEV